MKKPKAKARQRKAAPRRKESVTVSDLIRSTAAQLTRARLVFAHGTTDPAVEAAFIVGETLGIHPDYVAARAAKPVTAAQRKKVQSLVAQRTRTRKPAAYLLKRIYMLGVPFYIDQRAIVPRSFLGEIFAGELFAGEEFSLVRDANAVGRILDLCTGSGCLAILAAMRFPNAMVDAVELSKGALAVAKRNVADHRMKNRVRLRQGDLFAPVEGRRYDLIVSNPPYVDGKGMKGLPPECRHEPAIAFDGGADGLAVVRRIIDEAGAHLNERGGLLCEIGRGRQALERAYPDLQFLWLDTEASSGEVFWLDAKQLR
ncbi:MAG: 50S ribosomal protein L3 N(5)-glutamine methyltransferase [Xanthobacteraceae bacterium]|nr:50S ribosomal protein L3 N(5)-glutamine methyltransferase [Xanthobacteraceae bacterium]